jgi:hypothetical protein
MIQLAGKVGPGVAQDRSAATNCTIGRHQDWCIVPRFVAGRLRCDQIATPERRCRVRQSIRPIDRRLRKMGSRIAKLGDLPADITPHVLRHSSAIVAADLGYNEPTIATLLGHKAHSITSRYVHSADAVLLAATDAVANVTMNLMALDQAQPQLRDQHRDGSGTWDEFTSL